MIHRTIIDQTISCHTFSESCKPQVTKFEDDKAIKSFYDELYKNKDMKVEKWTFLEWPSFVWNANQIIPVLLKMFFFN